MKNPIRAIITAIVVVLASTNMLCQNNEGVSIKPTSSPPHESAMLEVYSTSKGVLIPRVNLTNVTDGNSPITNALPSLLVFNENTGGTGLSGRGYYYWDQSKWNRFNTSPELWTKISSGPHINYTAGKVVVGNAGGVAPTYQFEVKGTEQSLFRMKGYFNQEFRLGWEDNEVDYPSSGPGTWLTMKSGSMTTNWNGVDYTGPSSPYSWPTIFAMMHGTKTSSGVPQRALTIHCFGKLAEDTGGIIINGNKAHTFITTDGRLTAWAGAYNGFTSLGTGGNWIPTSDSTLKTDIETESSVLSRISQCRPVTYRYKTQSESAAISHGFLAQELEEIFPELVMEHSIPDPFEPGSEEEPTTATYTKKMGVNYTGLISVLLKAIQEQQTLITELESRVENLENP